eukprot:3285493-Ditylum_brightwellii.AAC.1
MSPPFAPSSTNIDTLSQVNMAPTTAKPSTAKQMLFADQLISVASGISSPSNHGNQIKPDHQWVQEKMDEKEREMFRRAPVSVIVACYDDNDLWKTLKPTAIAAKNVLSSVIKKKAPILE